MRAVLGTIFDALPDIGRRCFLVWHPEEKCRLICNTRRIGWQSEGCQWVLRPVAGCLPGEGCLLCGRMWETAKSSVGIPA